MKTIESEDSSNISREHPFKPLNPDNRPQTSDTVRNVMVLQSDTIYQKGKDDLVLSENKEIEPVPIKRTEKKKSTIMSAGLMMTNACLGTTIFTFAIKAKTFGLVWFLVAVTIVGIINYWTIMAGAKASSRCELDDYSEITEKILGRKARVILNVILIVYSYACMMCFLALIFPLFGRFIQSIAYNGKYDSYDDFSDKKWGKLYIKVIFYVIVSFAISMMCLIDDINKLNFSSYIGVGAVIYTLIVVAAQCHSYYNYYKKTEYKDDIDSTHPNWTNLGDAFKSDLDFFKGMANLFCAYACHPNIFPVYAGFKEEKKEERAEGLKKMSLGTIFATALTTLLHIVSIVCSFLTDPVTPEDLVIYRKCKDNGKDIPMGIAKLAVFASLIFTLPAYYFTLRLSIVNSFIKGKMSKKFNYIFTFASVFACSVVAIVYDKILNYLSYIGGFISVFICYMIPVLLDIKSNGMPKYYWTDILQFIGAVILCIIGVTAGILTIIDDVKG